MSLTINKLTSNTWQHVTSSNDSLILGRASAKISGNKFILSEINGQKPIATFDATEINVFDTTTSTNYTFSTGQELGIKLKELGYVGFLLEADVVIADLISSEAGNIIRLSLIDGKLYAEDSGGGGSTGGLITSGYTKATDFGNANFYPKAMFLDAPIQDDANTDIWLASTFTNQRVIQQFGRGLTLDKVTYVNGTRSVDGSLTTFGAKTVTLYALIANVDPVFTYGVTDANYVEIFSGDLDEYTIAQSKSPPEVPLANVPAQVFGLVWDIDNNYAAAGRIEVRRLSAFEQ